LSEDQKNIDLILLTIGVLIGVAVGLFVIARDMGNETQARMMMNDPEVQAVVDARIQPFGRVVLDGETVEDEADVAAVTQPVSPVTVVASAAHRRPVTKLPGRRALRRAWIR
jgi:hypothetical protein